MENSYGYKELKDLIGNYPSNLTNNKSDIDFEEFYFEPLDITLEDIMRENKVPRKRKILELILKSRKKRREELELLSKEDFDKVLKDYYRTRDKKYEQYLLERERVFHISRLSREVND